VSVFKLSVKPLIQVFFIYTSLDSINLNIATVRKARSFLSRWSPLKLVRGVVEEVLDWELEPELWDVKIQGKSSILLAPLFDRRMAC